MLASDIIDRVRIVLNDADGTRWPSTELLKWINDAQKAVVVVRPDACSATTTVTLVAGTKQTLPTDGLHLLDVIRNVSSAGAAGKIVRPVDRDILDVHAPDWHTMVSGVTVKNYVYDQREPKTFYVYPGVAAGVKIDILYSKVPAEATATGSTLVVSDIYLDALVNYVLFRAYSKDAEFATNAELSALYLQAFQGGLGIKTQKDVAYSPDLNSRGRTTPSSGASIGGV